MADERHVSNYSTRKKTYIKNAVISTILRLFKFKRISNIWIFGCWGGKKFDDNSRFLFEYILSHHPEIYPVWITKSEDIFIRLKSSNIPVELSSSPRGKELMKKAGVAFYTNGLDDFSDIPLVYGAKLIHLSHAAAGIKKSGFEKSNYKNKVLKLTIKRIKDFFFDWYAFDINIATSEESRKSHASTYGYNRLNKIQITGLPRNDLLVHTNLFKCNNPEYIDEKFKYILYLPTYRTYNNDVVKSTVSALTENIELSNCLRNNKYKILIKLHPEDSGELTGDENIVILNNNVVDSTQQLLLKSSCLITDYSSCCMDFSLKNQPVILYAPDYKKYNSINGIMDLWLPIFEGNKVLKNRDDLISSLIEMCCTGGVKTHDLSDWINSVYEDLEIKNSIYSENVIKKVKQIMNFKEKSS